jgi:hypothetical protein
MKAEISKFSRSYIGAIPVIAFTNTGGYADHLAFTDNHAVPLF